MMDIELKRHRLHELNHVMRPVFVPSDVQNEVASEDEFDAAVRNEICDRAERTYCSPHAIDATTAIVHDDFMREDTPATPADLYTDGEGNVSDGNAVAGLGVIVVLWIVLAIAVIAAWAWGVEFEV